MTVPTRLPLVLDADMIEVLLEHGVSQEKINELQQPAEKRSSDDDDHYYGAWSGGKKSEGGHPAGKGKGGLAPVATAVHGDKLTGNGSKAGAILGDKLVVWDTDTKEVQRHLADLDLLPPATLAHLRDSNVTVFVSHDSAGEGLRGLSGTPRGWREGKTWRDVPGVYRPATSENGREVWIGNNASHGSKSLALHEIGHAIDDTAWRPSNGELFRSAWRQACLKYTTAPYYKQPGDAGPQEMFAEAHALYVTGGVKAVTRKFGAQYSFMIDDFMKYGMTAEP